MRAGEWYVASFMKSKQPAVPVELQEPPTVVCGCMKFPLIFISIAVSSPSYLDSFYRSLLSAAAHAAADELSEK